MSHETINLADEVRCSIAMGPGVSESARIRGYYHVECHDADGNLKWADIAENLVTTVGKNELLDKFMDGSAYTPTIYMGLKGTGSANAADTMASHAGWSEVGGTNAPAYTGDRKTPPFVNAPSSGAITQSTASSFAITSGGDIDGVFLVINSGASATKDNTGGILFSAGTFAGGSRTVANTDTVSVTYSLTLT